MVHWRLRARTSLLTTMEAGSFLQWLVAKAIFESVSAYISGLRVLDVSPPILMKISFSGMSGVGSLVDRYRLLSPPPYERETLHLPHAILAEYRDDGTCEAMVAEKMDFLWNAYGFERCSLFDEQGNWLG